MGLSADQRLRSSRAFDEAVRRGRRAGSRCLVVHLFEVDSATSTAAVGFVVSKAVGASVVRHRVTRRLRALVRARHERVPIGAQVVVRALPAAATATSAQLAADLDRCLDRLLASPGSPARASVGASVGAVAAGGPS